MNEPPREERLTEFRNICGQAVPPLRRPASTDATPVRASAWYGEWERPRGRSGSKLSGARASTFRRASAENEMRNEFGFGIGQPSRISKMEWAFDGLREPRVVRGGSGHDKPALSADNPRSPQPGRGVQRISLSSNASSRRVHQRRRHQRQRQKFHDCSRACSCAASGKSDVVSSRS